MAENVGKKFERVVREAFERVPTASVDRLYDQTNGFKGGSNICDFIVYRKPYEYYIECKSVRGNTLSIHGTDPEHRYGNITNKQWESLLKKSRIPGVVAGILCWWIDKDVTLFIPIELLTFLREVKGFKSIRYDIGGVMVTWNGTRKPIHIRGRKKRVFFEYDMKQFFAEVNECMLQD